ncbi:MAG: acyl-phosphate glycerol 3-phosphate acyltransferase [Betaproteobacteria bacterium RIFCSPLOWO2_12_FULL_63_13]|nr:MAG: acyl-phosphate glycerol 3-phosphate acyltransferase [Betaproteobacteria bacterium RIFCSPLOWO2_12_FULL_63_13]
MMFFRSLAFTSALVLVTLFYSSVALALFALRPRPRWRVVSGWARAVIWLSRVLTGISYQVEGLQHLPKEPAVILSKHQSAWETIAFQLIFPPQVQVLKRELLWIPFFGWGLAQMSPIAIDRSRGSGALKQMAAQGAKRVAQGFWILIYPEGTRIGPGKRGKYHVGGAWVACRLGIPVVPVAHNAGLYWGKNEFLKRPGQIKVRIGEPIYPQGMKPETVTAKAEEWIEARMAELCPA